MSNPGIENVPVAAPVVEPVVQPVAAPVAPAVVEAPVVAPVVETPPAAVVEAVVAPVVAPEAKPAETVLAAEIDKNTPPPEANKTEGGQSEEPAPPPKEVVPQEIVKPTYEDFVLPEGMTLEKERVSKFTDLLADFELKGKADHAVTQEIGQKMVEFHINEIQQVAENYNKLLQANWEKEKTAWKEQFLQDPELGGNRFQTTVNDALSFIRTHGGTAEQQAEFRNLMETSGLGNHPVMIRILANAGRTMTEGKPLAAVKPVSAPKSKTSTLYGTSN